MEVAVDWAVALKAVEHWGIETQVLVHSLQGAGEDGEHGALRGQDGGVGVMEEGGVLVIRVPDIDRDVCLREEGGAALVLCPQRHLHQAVRLKVQPLVEDNLSIQRILQPHIAAVEAGEDGVVHHGEGPLLVSVQGNNLG